MKPLRREVFWGPLFCLLAFFSSVVPQLMEGGKHISLIFVVSVRPLVVA